MLEMAIRTFVFCDVCNPQGIRYVEQRRGGKRDGTHGRRVTDGRSWHEGSLSDAAQSGWAIDRSSRHVCPRCQSRKLHEK
jgi:hypothetical protein